MTSSNRSINTPYLSIRKKQKPSRFFTDAEKEFMEKNASELTAREMADAIGGVTHQAVRSWCENHGYPPKSVKKRWTGKDIQKLKALWPDTDAREIAKILGFSYQAVSHKAHQYGFYKSPEYASRVYKEAAIKRAKAKVTGGRPKGVGVPVVILDSTGAICKTYKTLGDVEHEIHVAKGTFYKACTSPTHKHYKFPGCQVWLLSDFNKQFKAKITV